MHTRIIYEFTIGLSLKIYYYISFEKPAYFKTTAKCIKMSQVSTLSICSLLKSFKSCFKKYFLLNKIL